LEKVILKIKAVGRTIDPEDQQVMKEAVGFDSVVGQLHSAKQDWLVKLEDAMQQKLKSYVTDIEPIIGEHLAGLRAKLLDIISHGYPSLDKDAVRRIGTTMAFGGLDIEPKTIETVLVAGAGAELVHKAAGSYNSTVDIATDYSYEKLYDSLEQILDRMQQPVDIVRCLFFACCSLFPHG
jgi:hypothetical protein